MLLSISAINFSGKTAMFSPEKKSAFSLKSLTKDEVSFGSHFPMDEALESIKNHKLFSLEKSKIFDIKTIKIKLKNDTKPPVKAFMTTVEYDSSNQKEIGLAIFSKKGKLLGNIEELNTKEWKTLTKYKSIGKYLRLHCLRASYDNDYKEIGTALIQEAIRQSKNMGLGGQLKVDACNYLNSGGSPIPFYAKMGFIDPKNPHLSKDEIIAKYADNPPKSLTMFLLSPENKENS